MKHTLRGSKGGVWCCSYAPGQALYLFCCTFTLHCPSAVPWLKFVCMHACMHVCMYTCIACMYVCVCARASRWTYVCGCVRVICMLDVLHPFRLFLTHMHNPTIFIQLLSMYVCMYDAEHMHVNVNVCLSICQMYVCPSVCPALPFPFLYTNNKENI